MKTLLETRVNFQKAKRDDKMLIYIEGNCLELAADGILNHVKCGNFSFGCPEEDFPSNEIYKCKNCGI
jgi:hypothetical protein